MGIPYFNGLSWNDLSREERFYCFILYQNAKGNPRQFAELVAEKAGLSIESTDEWDIGVEVCFYRDYLWHQGEHVHKSSFSPKRTFDLCLFSPDTIIVIEAKAYEPLDVEQNQTFKKDAKDIRDLLNDQNLKVYLIALASSKYFEAETKHDNGCALQVFDGHISWADTFDKYGERPSKTSR